MRQLASSLAIALFLVGDFMPLAHADETAIRKAVQERLREFPKVDEVRRLPGAGLYELRIGDETFYADERGEYLIAGSVLETKTRRNVTDARRMELQAEQLKALPLADAVKTVRGSGERRLVVFADPNCGYCKKLEPELEKLTNVTIYTFLFPILGSDSVAKSRDIWCAKDPGLAWSAWMLRGQAIPGRPANCAAVAVDRNLALGRRMKVSGTPAMFFADGKLVPGATDAGAIERQLKLSSGLKP